MYVRKTNGPSIEPCAAQAILEVSENMSITSAEIFFQKKW